MRAGKTHYTPPAGHPRTESRPSPTIIRRRMGLPTQPDQVVVSNGAKHSIHNALMAVCGPGDEVIIPAPYWVSYADLVKLTGASAGHRRDDRGIRLQAVARPVPRRGGHAPDQAPDDQQPRSNPTGVVYDRAELEALADAVLTTDVGVLSDEIYEQLTYGDARADLLRDPPAGPGRADDHDLGGEQDLRHDRLADRLGGGVRPGEPSSWPTSRARRRATPARSASMRPWRRSRGRRTRSRRCSQASPSGGITSWVGSRSCRG